MIKKKFLKTKCKVEFILPEAVSEEAETVYLVGDFNDWSETETPMVAKGKKRKQFKVQIDLPLNEQFHFRYLVDGNWHNEWDNEDGYAPNPYEGDNSIIDTTPPTE